MANYLVTGGCGFIGSHIAEALVGRGQSVRIVDNLSTGNQANVSEFADRVDLRIGDIADGDFMREAVQGIDIIFHQAALASVPRSVERPLDTHAACVTGTVTLLDAARRAGVRRVVYAASSSAYGDLEASSKRETDLPGPLSPYAAAKLAAEYYCHAFYRTYGLETVAIRYFNVFGPRQDPDSPYSAVIPIFISKMLAGVRPVIYGDGYQSRDFTFVANVVHGNLLASEAKDAPGRTINVANGHSVTLRKLVSALNERLGTNIEPEYAPPRVGDVKESMADITLARRVLDYEPQVYFDEGLDRSIAYYRSLIEA
ncbi:MAG: SDR family oxidoreductase [Pirellulaceae bacterium]|nr:SDR family oxidoreductase [Planctomycetales bacterium]MCA9221163.1 SDR family oxidoreductase [Planctomycetales bacterium]MCA9225993.1 SDR family oxidoreductase [Planctomycetales bacterium]